MKGSVLVERPVAAHSCEVGDQLRFYVDENALGLGKALAIARRDVIHVGHPLIPEDVVPSPVELAAQ